MEHSGVRPVAFAAPRRCGQSRPRAAAESRRRASHGLARFAVGSQTNQLGGQSLGVRHDTHRAGVTKQANDVTKILGVRPDQHGDSMNRGFEDVMSATRRQAATDKRHVRQGIDRPQFSNAVEQENATGDGFLLVPLRSLPARQIRSGQQSGHGRKAFGMARRQHQHGLGKSLPQGNERAQYRRLFAFYCRAGDNDGRSPAAKQGRAQGRNNGWFLRKPDIELQIPATRRRSAAAPISRKRRASSSLCARKRFTGRSTSAITRRAQR